jgi:uncharacterized repeat protein (TIGR03803 family)
MKRVFNALGKLALCATTAIALPAQTFTTLHTFGGTDGAFPAAGLVQATNGGLYGTTNSWGPNYYPGGTVFKIMPSGTLTTLYNFCGQSSMSQNCTDGQAPDAGLVQATNGYLYGTTYGGGANGYGTVFKMTAGGTLTTLYSFCSQSGCTDGRAPSATLVQATNGDLYGTTLGGGTVEYAFGPGTMFKMTPTGTLTAFDDFSISDACVEGAGPSGLVQGTDGDLYGTTGGGSGTCQYGSVFKATLGGKLTTIYNFCSQGVPNCTDGSGPDATLVQATDGNFYGTTAAGGSNYAGTVFKITPSGQLTTLHSFFSPGDFQSTNPLGGLVQGTDGNLYGTTQFGGANNGPLNSYGGGTVFKITPSGTLTTLYNFCSQANCADGGYPSAGLVQATDGNFYGTATYGGNSGFGCGQVFNGCGTVFKLSVGLKPFVKTLPTSGKVGAAVKILGTNLKGASSVSFNGTAALFKVVSASEITATVPTGATTGTVQVVTPRGTFSSNVPFRVLP